MIAFLRGVLRQIKDEKVIIDTNGIGYEVTVPARCLRELPSLGKEVTLYTCLRIKDDEMQLYGFSSPEDVGFFKLLQKVSGIGPRGACAVLAKMSVQDGYCAISGENVEAFRKIPGIGPKTARRIILELKETITLELKAGKVGILKAEIEPLVYREAAEALSALGYNEYEMKPYLELGLKELADATVEDLVRFVLREWGRNKNGRTIGVTGEN